MPIDLNNTLISDEPIPGLVDDQLSWQPPTEFPKLPKGQTAYSLKINQIREANDIQTANGKRINVTLDFEIVGGERDGTKVTFQRLNNVEFNTNDRGRTSFLLDFIMSTGARPNLRSNKDFLVQLNAMEAKGNVAKGYLDWEGMCLPCFDKALMEKTGGSDRETSLKLADPKIKKEARKFATKAKNYGEFPENPLNPKEKLEYFECPTCGEEVRAQVKITRWFRG